MWKNLGEVNFFVNYNFLSVVKGIHTQYMGAAGEIIEKETIPICSIKNKDFNNTTMVF